MVAGFMSSGMLETSEPAEDGTGPGAASGADPLFLSLCAPLEDVLKASAPRLSALKNREEGEVDGS